MPDHRSLPWLARLLPTRAREEFFLPAWHDLRIERLTNPARAGYAAGLLFLFLECWRLELAETLTSPRRRAESETALPSPPKDLVSMFLHDIRHALRLFARERAFTAAALLTLALGVGANVAVFAVVEAVLLRPLPYSEADGLVILKHRDLSTGVTKPFIAMGDYVDLAGRQSSFESVAGYGGAQPTLFGPGEPFRAQGLAAAPGLLETLRVRPEFGRTLRPEDGREGAAPVMLIGHDLWESRFGSDPNIIGRGVKVGSREVQVVGVMPRGFQFPPNSRTEVILPMTVPKEAPAQRKGGWTFAAARLKPGVSLTAAAGDMAAISRALEREFPQSNQGSEYFALPLRDSLVGDTKPALILMLAAVGVVLLIACANVANLLLARSLTRSREMAVRMALGAGRRRLMAQLLTESLVLASAAGSLGVLIANWGARALVALVPRSIGVAGLSDVRIDPVVLAFALTISVATALAFGIMSAFTVRADSASATLAASGRVTAGGPMRKAASALVVAEVALAMVLLIGAGLILKSFSRLLSVDPGFRTEGVLTLSIAAPSDRYRETPATQAFYRAAFAALKELPEVQDVGAAVVVPLTGNNWTAPFERPEHPVPAGERPPEVGWQLASSGYFRALQIALLSGRLFEDRDESGKPVVIISEAIQRRYFPGEDPLGRSVRIGDQTAEIVGVVANIRRAGLKDEPRADLYFPFESEPVNEVTLFIRSSGDPVRVTPLARAALRSIEPGLTLAETRTMAQIASDSIEVTRLALWLLGVFAATALALALVGIYGVMSYVAKQRSREIGTRIALGAGRGDILWLVMRQGVIIAGLGGALGVGGGLLASRSLSSIVYGVTTSDPITLLIALAVLSATTAAACFLPAHRASRVDPARTLAEP